MGKLPTHAAGSGAWRSVTLEIPVPAVVEAGLAAAAAHLQHVTLLHVVVAAALALFVRALLQRWERVRAPCARARARDRACGSCARAPCAARAETHLPATLARAGRCRGWS